ncbi:DNA repair protein RecO [Caldisericum exile]|uniref:DNA repair protein RecO n=1 Tax=Caldisericum exile (strain DSM 21853 / NBRC 104410 / AZM16c01) TaxID=511051 RepID=A0A7U6GEK8_CALEA|nr:DNA repair protein RecO [Caldisericum exile]BAL80963.1 recombination protein O RecO family protein [Caldisericum exile AZM16c01]
MGYININGLTITSFDTKETDRYVVMLTDKLGKINVKFKSVRTSTSKRSGYTDSFVYEKVQLYKKGNTYIATEIEMLDDFRDAKNDLSKMVVLLYIKELLLLLLPYEEENMEILDLTLKTLSFLSSVEPVYSKVALLYYMFHFMKLLGSPINFLQEHPKVIYFSFENNGFNENSGFTVDAVVYEESLLLNKMAYPEKLNIVKFNEILDLLNYYIIQKFELDEYKKFLESVKTLSVR